MKKLVKVVVAIIIAINIVVVTPMVMEQQGYAVQAASVKISSTKKNMYKGLFFVRIIFFKTMV